MDRVVALAVREGLKDEWTVHGAALSLLDLTRDIAVVRRARARVSDVVLRSPSMAGTRAVAALNVVLGRLRSDDDASQDKVPSQRAPEDAPHLSRALELDGSGDSIGEAVLFVRAHVCDEHGLTVSGRAMLLAQELLNQTVGRLHRPAHVVVACNGRAVMVYVDLVAESGMADEPDLTLLGQLADDHGSQALRPGVRYWAQLAV